MNQTRLDEARMHDLNATVLGMTAHWVESHPWHQCIPTQIVQQTYMDPLWMDSYFTGGRRFGHWLASNSSRRSTLEGAS